MKTFNKNAIIYTIAVIPAKAGIHFDLLARARWIPAFGGMTASERVTAIASLAHVVESYT